MPLHFNAFHVEMKGGQNPKYYPVRADGTLGDEQGSRWKAENVAKRWRDEYIAEKPHRADMAEAAWKRYQDRPRKEFEYQYKNTRTGQIVSGIIASDHILEAEAELDRIFAERGNKEGGGSLTYQNQGLKPSGSSSTKTNQNTQTGSTITENPPEAPPVMPQTAPIQPPPGVTPPPSTTTQPVSMDRPMWGDFHSESDLENLEKFTGFNPFIQNANRASFSDFHTEQELENLENKNQSRFTWGGQQTPPPPSNRPPINVGAGGPNWRGGFGPPPSNTSNQPPPNIPPPTPPAPPPNQWPASMYPGGAGGAVSPSGTPQGSQSPSSPQNPVNVLNDIRDTLVDILAEVTYANRGGGGGPGKGGARSGGVHHDPSVLMNYQVANIGATNILGHRVGLAGVGNLGPLGNFSMSGSIGNLLPEFARGITAAAGAIVIMVQAVFEVTKALRNFSEETLESRRKYAAFGGNLAQFAHLDINQFNRQRVIAAGTGESTRDLIKSIDSMRDKFVKFDTAMINIQNRLASAAADLAGNIGEGLGEVLDKIDSALNVGILTNIGTILAAIAAFDFEGAKDAMKKFADAIEEETKRKDRERDNAMNKLAPADEFLKNMRRKVLPIMRG